MTSCLAYPESPSAHACRNRRRNTAAAAVDLASSQGTPIDRRISCRAYPESPASRHVSQARPSAVDAPGKKPALSAASSSLVPVGECG